MDRSLKLGWRESDIHVMTNKEWQTSQRTDLKTQMKDWRRHGQRERVIEWQTDRRTEQWGKNGHTSYLIKELMGFEKRQIRIEMNRKTEGQIKRCRQGTGVER